MRLTLAFGPRYANGHASRMHLNIWFFSTYYAKRISEKFFDTEFCPPSPPTLGEESICF
ncbi:MAG: hypothetical protein F6K53_15795 [Moorea sp. SIO4A1]|uniref:hypothetical protein n=1 Tax=Moorena sp. SIO4A1 TaxID=2607835 RepID=UPI00144F1E36|nr:hypothetical protein [Moorena sp. SIO4A1]NEQ58775.1 hypothetical protein [Moorena sp. SIO4A1]